jgi:hypothetical protein
MVGHLLVVGVFHLRKDSVEAEVPLLNPAPVDRPDRALDQEAA